MKKHILIFTIVALAATGFISCDGDLTKPVTVDTSHTLEALLVQDMETELSYINLTLKRNGADLTTAFITLGGLTISSDSTGYYRQFTTGQFPAGADYNLRIVDSTILDTTLTITLPGSFSINDAGFRNFTGSAEAVSWVPSSGSDGYILATTTPTGSISDDGYEEFVFSNEASIPPEAFIYLLDRIEGYHTIFVSAYQGTPMDVGNLPFEIPATGGPANNLATENLTGRIGGLVIALPDSITVPAS